MDKIKNNVPSLGERIRAIVFADPMVTARLRMHIAENIFIFSAFLYFFFILMAVGGFFPYFSSAAVFFFYPVFTLSIVLLVFSIINYALTIHAEWLLFIRYPLFLGFCVGYVWLIAHHIGIYPFLLSLLWM